jgi:pimeloyl-ACP methyl ester carboxylesterase
MRCPLPDGGSLWYEDREGIGVPVLFHHGYTASRYNWLHVADDLHNKGHRTILIECRGAGESDHVAGGYNIPQYADDVVTLLDHLGIAKVTFCGHSMGGGVGMIMGTRHMDRLDKLVLMASIPSGGVSTHNPGDTLTEAGIPEFVQVKHLLELDHRWENTEWTRDDFYTRRALEKVALSEKHHFDSSQSMREHSVDMQDIRTPTLVVAGAADVLLKANLRDFMQLPHATLCVLPRVGHEVAVQAPAAVAAAIGDFLEHGCVDLKTALTKSKAKLDEIAAKKKLPRLDIASKL